MKKNLSIALLIFIMSLLLTDIVMAAYYIDIDVTEGNGTDYDMLAMNVPMDIDYLADNGFINEDGLDVRLQNSQGTDLLFMLADDKLIFASAIQGDKTTGLQMTTGNTPLNSFPVVVGDGGYATISDNANLELGSDFELIWEGYIDTTVSDDLISKTDSVNVSSDGAGHITATLYKPRDIEQTTVDTTMSLYNGSNTRVGAVVENVPEDTIIKLSFYLIKSAGNPTGTAYARVRRESDDAIIGTAGSIDVSTLTGGWVWYDFTDTVSNPTKQDLRVCIEYNGGDGSNYISTRYDTDSLLDGTYRTYYDGSWHDAATDEGVFKLYYQPNISVTATVASGESEIKIVGDGSDLKIYEDGSLEDTSTSMRAAIDNANDWVLMSDAIPYMDSYAHTTSDTLRITYQPDDIISGTTLSNEDNPGTYDGTITWGANPAGISIATSGLGIEESYYYTGGETGTTDIFEPEPAELAPGQDSDKLDRNPLKPGVEGFAEASNGAFTESLVWYGIAWFSIIAVGIALIILVREHLVFAAATAFGLSIFWYVSGVLDYWVLIIFGIFLGASLIHEKQPTW